MSPTRRHPSADFTRRSSCSEVRILSDDEVRLLHTRALDILEKVGIKYESKRALDFWRSTVRKSTTQRALVASPISSRSA